MIHGGDLISFKDLYDGKIIDYSSNINPLGYPKVLNKVLEDALKDADKYPDIKYRNLKKSISKYLGCSEEEVVVGNGAVEIIDVFIMMFKRIITFNPCFIEYEKRAKIHNKEVLEFFLDENFNIDINLLYENIKEGDCLILGNPNNPTGKRINEDILKNIVRLIENRNAFLILDEAFYEFCPFFYDSIKLFKESKNVAIIRAATKFFALPGIRLGYAFTNSNTARKYDETVLPWSVNVFADVAGSIIFDNISYLQNTKEYINEQRQYLLKELKNVSCLKVFDTDCNFILIKLLKGNEDDLFCFMIKRGILIRKASSFKGLDKTYIRIAVKDFENNSYLIKCFKEYEEFSL
ncbi:MAG: aminotransferase class I/II-fold pyridoxal phosphate-dependent enzyme [Caloramator sp.]|nr:aminotransferase class I/II-fold pyridoxal phosphate-dependent enzyme [Caloramator sp.]